MREWDIREAENGLYCRQWGHPDDPPLVTVHEAENEAEALVELLWEHFSDLFQSKGRGGLVLREGLPREEEDEIVSAAEEVAYGLPPVQRQRVLRALGVLQGEDPGPPPFEPTDPPPPSEAP